MRSSVRAQGIQRAYRSEEIPGSEDCCDLHVPASWCTCNPIVEVGDTVKVGQKIGEAAGFISAPVHSSVSGTVVAVEPRMHGTRGSEVMAVVIESDGKNTLHESVQPHKALDELTPDEIIEIVKDAGIVGMGGAGFPTCVKLKPAKPVDTILLNGCECEPYLTADHKVLLEFADDIIFGLKAILKTTGAEKGIIVIEDNKQDAIELMQKKLPISKIWKFLLQEPNTPRALRKLSSSASWTERFQAAVFRQMLALS